MGKPTTAVNLTAALHDLGLRVLLCDFDPQANATSGLGLDKRKCKYSIYDVLINDVPAEDAIVSTPYGDVLPSASDLAGATVELISAQHRERQLDMALNGIKERYDSDLRGLPAVIGAADAERAVRSGRDSGAGAVRIFRAGGAQRPDGDAPHGESAG